MALAKAPQHSPAQISNMYSLSSPNPSLTLTPQNQAASYHRGFDISMHTLSHLGDLLKSQG